MKSYVYTKACTQRFIGKNWNNSNVVWWWLDDYMYLSKFIEFYTKKRFITVYKSNLNTSDSKIKDSSGCCMENKLGRTGQEARTLSKGLLWVK